MGHEAREKIALLLKLNIEKFAGLSKKLDEYIHYQTSLSGSPDLYYYDQLRKLLLDLTDLYLVPDYKDLPETSPEQVDCSLYDSDQKPLLKFNSDDLSLKIGGAGSFAVSINQNPLVDPNGKAVQVGLSFPYQIRTESPLAFMADRFLTVNLQRKRRETVDISFNLFKQSPPNMGEDLKFASFRLKCGLR